MFVGWRARFTMWLSVSTGLSRTETVGWAGSIRTARQSWATTPSSHKLERSSSGGRHMSRCSRLARGRMRGRDGLIVTSRPLPSPPPRVRPVTVSSCPPPSSSCANKQTAMSGLSAVVRLREKCLSAGLIDELELYVIPTLLGAGIPLLSHHASLIPLRLLDQQVFSGGVTRLRYAVEKQAPLPHGSSLASD